MLVDSPEALDIVCYDRARAGGLPLFMAVFAVLWNSGMAVAIASFLSASWWNDGGGARGIASLIVVGLVVALFIVVLGALALAGLLLAALAYLLNWPRRRIRIDAAGVSVEWRWLWPRRWRCDREELVALGWKPRPRRGKASLVIRTTRGDVDTWLLPVDETQVVIERIRTLRPRLTVEPEPPRG